MSKQAVSVTLRSDNLLWLKTRVRVDGLRSLSEALDQIITRARSREQAGDATIRSVVGNARMLPSDAALEEAGQDLRRLFRTSVARSGEDLFGQRPSGRGRAAGRKRA